MERDWEPCDAEPHAEAEINENTIVEEATEATVQEVEEPLLSSVGPVMPNVAASVGWLLVVILFTVPRTVLHLGNSESLAVGQAHVLHVPELVVGQTASFSVHN